MNEHAISKALEIWTLQNLVNLSILAGLLATGLALAQAYWRELEAYLSLRVSMEIWRLLSILLPDALLSGTVLVGYATLNPDIMADVKIALPFYPLATLLFAAALVLRIFRGGHAADSPNFRRALWLSFSACALNVTGFTYVAEAPSREYLARHPSPGWEWITAHLRSNADPEGLELSQTVFLICFPLLLVIAAWALQSALRKQEPDA